MAARKPFLLRVDPRLLEALQRWANDELRSLNGQIEFLLRRVLQEAGRLPRPEPPAPPRPAESGGAPRFLPPGPKGR